MRGCGFMFKKKSKKYYLEKMRHGQITDEEVARIFNTSISNVRNAFIEYSKNKNPFRQRNHNVITLAQIIISIISILLVYVTLLEMQVDRNNAYLPDIYFNKTSFVITWDVNGSPDLDCSDDEMFQALCQTTNYVNMVPRIELENIGMGTAKNIHLEWAHSSNMRALVNYLYTINDTSSFTYEINGHFTVITADGHTIQSTSRPFLDITYMKNEPQGDSISIPYEYWLCIRHICRNYNSGGLNLPDIKIALHYYDIQGKEYRIEKTIQIQLYMLTLNPDNSGYASFNLIEI